MSDLSAAGLTNIEAACYTTLLTRPTWKPSELAKAINETRSNCYKILERLMGYGLAERADKGKVLHYTATNPGRLLELARERRIAQEQSEKRLADNAQSLLADYIKTHEQPGVRLFQGKAAISDMFTAIAQAKDEVVFINTQAGIDFYGYDVMSAFRLLAPQAGVHRRALTPDIPVAPNNYFETDPKTLLKRTWLAADDYTAPVEWGAYDNTVYVISYGQDAIGMTIDNPQVAASFKQLFKLLERGQTAQPDYSQLPKNATR